MADRKRSPENSDRRTQRGFEVALPAQPLSPPPPTPADHLATTANDSTVPQLPAGFTVVDRDSGAVVWDVRSGTFVDAADLATAPEGTTKMSGNLIVAGGSIASDNFVEGASGWEITHDGNAEFNNLALRGVLEGIDGAPVFDAEFDTDVSGWIPEDSHTALAWTALDMFTPPGSMIMTSDGASTTAMAVGPEVAITAGKAYRFTAWARLFATPNRRIGMLVSWYDQFHIQIASGPVTEHYVTNTTDWNMVSGSFLAPPGAWYVRLSPYVSTLTGNLFAADGAYWDSIKVSPTSQSTVGVIQTADTGERATFFSGHGSELTFYSGEPGESAPGYYLVEMNGDTTGNRWQETHIKSAAVNGKPGKTFLDDPGGPIVPEVYCELQTGGTNTSVPSGSAGFPLSWNTAVRDALGMHTSVSAATVPYTGIYVITGTGNFPGASAGSQRGAFIYANRTKVLDRNEYNGQLNAMPGYVTSVGVSAVMYLTAGNYVELWLYHNAGSTLACSGNISVALIARLA